MFINNVSETTVAEIVRESLSLLTDR